MNATDKSKLLLIATKQLKMASLFGDAIVREPVRLETILSLKQMAEEAIKTLEKIRTGN